MAIEEFHRWKDGLVINLCSRKMQIFLKLVVHDQRKQKRGCGITFCSKGRNPPSEGNGPINAMAGG